MSIQSHGHEHELEPQYGLPERLPAGEKLLWQGSPNFNAVALRIFHVRKAAIYFAALMALRAGLVLADGGGLTEALLSLAWPLPLALTALCSLVALAWMTSRTAVYTLTDKRIVMRIGIVLTLTFNIPLRSIRSAALRQTRQDSGDIVIQLAGPDHIAFLHLWPHVRPWRVARPEPMLRLVDDAAAVATLLSQAWTAAVDGAAPDLVRPPVYPVLAPLGTATTAAESSPVGSGDHATARSAARSAATWQPSPT